LPRVVRPFKKYDLRRWVASSCRPTLNRAVPQV